MAWEKLGLLVATKFNTASIREQRILSELQHKIHNKKGHNLERMKKTFLQLDGGSYWVNTIYQMRGQGRYDDMFCINTLVNVLVGRVLNDRVKE